MLKLLIIYFNFYGNFFFIIEQVSSITIFLLLFIFSYSPTISIQLFCYLCTKFVNCMNRSTVLLVSLLCLFNSASWKPAKCKSLEFCLKSTLKAVWIVQSDSIEKSSSVFSFNWTPRKLKCKQIVNFAVNTFYFFLFVVNINVCCVEYECHMNVWNYKKLNWFVFKLLFFLYFCNFPSDESYDTVEWPNKFV